MTERSDMLAQVHTRLPFVQRNKRKIAEAAQKLEINVINVRLRTSNLRGS